MTTETNSVLNTVKEAFAPVTEAFTKLQNMEVPEAAREFVKKQAETAKERAADVYAGSEKVTAAIESAVNAAEAVAAVTRGHQEGGNIRFRWDRVYSERSSIMLQTYYDRNIYQLLPLGKSDAESFDIDFQHRFPLFDKHDVIWGTNYRLNNNKIFDTLLTKAVPQERTHHQFSGFIRDDITLVPDRLLFSLGTRLDHNNFSGLEVQPNARLMWTPNTQHSIWLSISRAVRIPSRGENDIILNLGQIPNAPGIPTLPIPISVIMLGMSNFDSEKLLAYELGYRTNFPNTHRLISPDSCPGRAL